MDPTDKHFLPKKNVRASSTVTLAPFLGDVVVHSRKYYTPSAKPPTGFGVEVVSAKLSNGYCTEVFPAVPRPRSFTRATKSDRNVFGRIRSRQSNALSARTRQFWDMLFGALGY